MARPKAPREYLLASDFDQTLSFNDSGIVLGELLGTHGFEEKVKGLARINLVQQGGELTYLLLHDPEYRKVRREHLVEVGRRIRLKPNIGRLVEILEHGIDGHRFSFYVVSAAPAGGGRVGARGARARASGSAARASSTTPATGEIRSVERVSAGYGKVAALAAAAGGAAGEPRPRGLRGRRQLRRARDAPRQPARRLHDRGLREPLHRADRAALDPLRGRAQRAGADPRGHRGLGRARRCARSSSGTGCRSRGGTRCAPTS